MCIHAIIAIFAIFIGFFMIFGRKYGDETSFIPGLICVAAGTCIVIAVLRQIKAIEKIALQRIKEVSGKNEIECTTEFTKDKINTYNITNGAASEINYHDIARVVETENMYTLFTKANQFVVANKNNLIEQDENENFKQFIREKCKNVKLKTNRR